MSEVNNTLLTEVDLPIREVKDIPYFDYFDDNYKERWSIFDGFFFDNDLDMATRDIFRQSINKRYSEEGSKVPAYKIFPNYDLNKVDKIEYYDFVGVPPQTKGDRYHWEYKKIEVPKEKVIPLMLPVEAFLSYGFHLKPNYNKYYPLEHEVVKSDYKTLSKTILQNKNWDDVLLKEPVATFVRYWGKSKNFADFINSKNLLEYYDAFNHISLKNTDEYYNFYNIIRDNVIGNKVNDIYNLKRYTESDKNLKFSTEVNNKLPFIFTENAREIIFLGDKLNIENKLLMNWMEGNLEIDQIKNDIALYTRNNNILAKVRDFVTADDALKLGTTFLPFLYRNVLKPVGLWLMPGVFPTINVIGKVAYYSWLFFNGVNLFIPGKVRTEELFPQYHLEQLDYNTSKVVLDYDNRYFSHMLIIDEAGNFKFNIDYLKRKGKLDYLLYKSIGHLHSKAYIAGEDVMYITMYELYKYLAQNQIKATRENAEGLYLTFTEFLNRAFAINKKTSSELIQYNRPTVMYDRNLSWIRREIQHIKRMLANPNGFYEPGALVSLNNPAPSLPWMLGHAALKSAGWVASSVVGVGDITWNLLSITSKATRKTAQFAVTGYRKLRYGGDAPSIWLDDAWYNKPSDFETIDESLPYYEFASNQLANDKYKEALLRLQNNPLPRLISGGLCWALNRQNMIYRNRDGLMIPNNKPIKWKKYVDIRGAAHQKSATMDIFNYDHDQNISNFRYNQRVAERAFALKYMALKNKHDPVEVVKKMLTGVDYENLLPSPKGTEMAIRQNVGQTLHDIYKSGGGYHVVDMIGGSGRVFRIYPRDYSIPKWANPVYGYFPQNYIKFRRLRKHRFFGIQSSYMKYRSFYNFTKRFNKRRFKRRYRKRFSKFINDY